MQHLQSKSDTWTTNAFRPICVDVNWAMDRNGFGTLSATFQSLWNRAQTRRNRECECDCHSSQSDVGISHYYERTIEPLHTNTRMHSTTQCECVLSAGIERHHPSTSVRVWISMCIFFIQKITHVILQKFIYYPFAPDCVNFHSSTDITNNWMEKKNAAKWKRCLIFRTASTASISELSTIRLVLWYGGIQTLDFGTWCIFSAQSKFVYSNIRMESVYSIRTISFTWCIDIHIQLYIVNLQPSCRQINNVDIHKLTSASNLDFNKLPTKSSP